MRKVQANFYKEMYKIYTFFQQNINLEDKIESLVKEHKLTSILEWETEFHLKHVSKVSKTDKILVFSYLIQ